MQMPTLLSIGVANLSPASLDSDGKLRSSILSLPLLPYSSMTVNATLWTLYGLLCKNPNLVVPNIVGIGLGLFYVTLFVFKSGGLSSSSSSSRNKYLPLSRSGGALPPAQTIMSRTDLPSTFNTQLVLSFALLTFALNAFRQSSKTTIGLMANFICGIMFISPLSSLFKIIREKHCARGSIPLPFTVVQGVNCFLWR